MDKLFIRVKGLIPASVFNLLAPIYHWKLAFLGALRYGFPSNSMKVIGVTGTSGKTTTVEFLHAIFSEAGYKTASMSSLRFKVLGKEEPNMLKMTMPGRFRIQKFLFQAKRAKAEYVFLEVTSEGIKQSRHKFIKFYAALFTNLSPEHLESHGGFENYRAAKAELFKISLVHILNGDDKSFDFFNNIPAKEKIVFRHSDYPADLKMNLAGDFNKMNATGAIAFARSEGVKEEVIRKAVEGVKVLPGRMEFVETGRDFKVLVDYAFLPQALEKVYETLKKDSQNKNLICVTGSAGGGRDKWKRPVLGDVADKFCKKVIVTNEDPYDEDPMEIINQVSGAHNFSKILDRREAIKEALKLARKDDVVVITGKGAEPWIVGPKGEKTAWDDRVVVREGLRGL
jgi:UDP-N-acetylmuramoyl-L-alanyl-D-glutamate--2,6-diaminopimelate ligase